MKGQKSQKRRQKRLRMDNRSRTWSPLPCLRLLQTLPNPEACHQNLEGLVLIHACSGTFVKPRTGGTTEGGDLDLGGAYAQGAVARGPCWKAAAIVGEACAKFNACLSPFVVLTASLLLQSQLRIQSKRLALRKNNSYSPGFPHGPETPSSAAGRGTLFLAPVRAHAGANGAVVEVAAGGDNNDTQPVDLFALPLPDPSPPRAHSFELPDDKRKNYQNVSSVEFEERMKGKKEQQTPTETTRSPQGSSPKTSPSSERSLGGEDALKEVEPAVEPAPTPADLDRAALAELPNVEVSQVGISVQHGVCLFS